LPNIPLEPSERLRRKNAFDASLVMGVRQFTLGTGRDRHIQESMSALLDADTGWLRQELAQDRTCPVCGGHWSEPLFIKAGFRHGRCPECGLIYVNPVLRDDAVISHYRQENSWTRVLESDWQIQFDRLKFNYGLDVAEPYVSGRKVLDVGAGNGHFLRVAAARDYQTVGVELNSAHVARLRAEGFRIIDHPLEEAHLDGHSFDLITLWETLEHITRPGPLLMEIDRILRPGGVLLILVPNADSLSCRLLHEKSGTFGGHSHVNCFNLESLSRLLCRTGFSVLESETLITELGTIHNYLNFEDPYLGQAGPVLDCLTPSMIHDRLLGSKLLTVARSEKDQE